MTQKRMGLPRRLEAPVFFTSAAKVKIPFVGDDTRSVKLADTRFYPIANPLEKHHNAVSKHFVKLVSNNVRFDDGVVRERCSHALPFNSHDFSSLYRPDFITPHAKTFPRGKEYLGRFDTVGCNRKPPCHLKKLHYPKVFKERANAKTAQVKSFEDDQLLEEDVLAKSVEKQPIEVPTAQKDQRYMSSEITVKNWEEVMLERLSKDTAHWIVYETAAGGAQKEKLGQYLREKYGEKLSNTHIVRADASETDLRKLQNGEKEDRKKAKDVERMQSVKNQQVSMRRDEVFKKSLAEYYRLPRFLSQQRSEVITTSDEVNESAHDLVVKHLAPSLPPKMEDFFSNVSAKYIKTTDNEFEQRLYTGQAKPVHQAIRNQSRVIMDDLSEYQVDVRTKYPLQPQNWAVGEAGNKSTEKENLGHERFARGLRRWVKLPQPADFISEGGLNPPRREKAQIEQMEYNKLDFMVDNRPLITLVEEWRSKWKLVGQWQDIPISEILIDMESIHSHIRLGAVAACAMASLHKKPLNELAGLAVTSQQELTKEVQNKKEGHLPDSLLNKVKEKITDKNKRVQLAAAICLYSLNHHSDEILGILKRSVKHGYGCDRLTCAQCLALSSNVSADIIQMILNLLLERNGAPSSTLTVSQRDQATMLLVHLSESTNLVHSLLAEQLNSSSWKDRIIACRVLSKLVGNINKDLVHKLTNLMWYDWSSEVRRAAAETLGHTGHGRDIHFELRNKLAQGNKVMRVNVLKKISKLGIMTVALLPTFMACFSDDYVSVRLQACKTAGKLRLHDESIAMELIRIMEFDPASKIKPHAIKAIREIGFYSEKLLKALIWALRFEDEPEVRIEACVALRSYYSDKKPDSEVLHVLQDKALVEPDATVKEEVQKTLKAFDAASYGDNMDMIRQIKSEVKRLCHKGVIAAKIAVYERELDKYQNKVHYIGMDLSEDQDSTALSPSFPVHGDIELTSLPRTPASSRHSPSYRLRAEHDAGNEISSSSVQSFRQC